MKLTLRWFSHLALTLAIVVAGAIAQAEVGGGSEVQRSGEAQRHRGTEAEVQRGREAEAQVESTVPTLNTSTPNTPQTGQAQSIPPTPHTPHPTPVHPDTPTPSSVKILTPAPDTLLDGYSSVVSVQFPEGASLKLLVNGTPVDSLLIGKTEVDSKNHVTTQTWYGVGFKPGENSLTAQATVNGVALPDVSIKVFVAGEPKELKISTEESRIAADGHSTATVKGQFLDEHGKVSNWESVVTLNTSAGEFIGEDKHPNTPGFQVESKKGVFSATLRSGLDAQMVRIQAKSLDLEGFTQIQFETALRKQPLVTGFVDLRLGARGVNFYDSWRDFLPLDKDYDTELDLSSAVFATGSIGEWSFKGAYNSDRPLNQDNDGENRLFRTYQTSEQDYPVFGDNSQKEVVTPSIDSVYLRFERSSKIDHADPNYFMWGDYHSEEFATASQEFSAMTRDLHGFKANYNFGNLQFTGFYANNIEGFQRDTIVPDGTSGYYFLSRRLLVSGSEDIYLELEELNNPGKLISRQRLSLGTDYEIDYDRGTLLFRQPLLRTDVGDRGQILVRRIVATYQFETKESDTDMIGGRVRYHLGREAGKESWIGATYLKENKSDHNFHLYGFDTLISLGENSKLIAEYANSANGTTLSPLVNGSAYRFDWQHQFSESIHAHAFYRRADEGFSNNATSSFVPGQTRYGGDVQTKISENTSLKFQYEHQDNFGIAPRPIDTLEEFLNPFTEPIPGSRVDNSLTTISTGIQQRFGRANLNVDLLWRDREDRLPPNQLSQTSSQLRTNFTTPLTHNLNLTALNETTLSSETDSVYSDRTAVGLDWEFIKGIKLNLSQQWFTRGQYAGKSITSIGVSGDYHPWHDATITGRYAVMAGDTTSGGSGGLGLKQKVTFTPSLHVNLGYEHTFSSFSSTGSGVQFSQPFAFGQGASALGFSNGDSYNVGVEYATGNDFKAGLNWEHRTSSGGKNTVLSANVSGKPSEDLTALLSYRQASSANQGLEDLGVTRDLKVGLAYRDPYDDSFNALLKYEYRENPSLIPESILFSQGTGSKEHVFSVEGIYAPDWRWEFYAKYALRNSSTYMSEDFTSSSTVSLLQLRATYRLGYHWDLAAESRWIWQPSAGYTETALLLEAGYYLTPDLRLSAGYAFGDIEDRDFSGSRSAGGIYFGVTWKVSDLIDDFDRQPTMIPAQPESEVKAKQASKEEK
jgi:hypothetical protein